MDGRSEGSLSGLCKISIMFMELLATGFDGDRLGPNKVNIREVVGPSE